MKNFSLYNNTCDICGDNFTIDKNNYTNINNNITNSDIYCITEELSNVECYYTCKSCYIKGNETHHNCIECKDEYFYEFNITNSNYKNCFENNTFDILNNIYVNMNFSSFNLTYGNYHDNLSEINDLISLINFNVSTDLNDLGISNEFSSSNNSDNSSDINNLSEFITEFSTNKKIDVENRTEIIQHIIDELIQEFNMTELNDGNDKKIIDQNKVIILTSTDNQKNNEDKNNISMNLGECENIIKREYSISMNDSLYILQIISEEEGMKIPKIEYEVYYPLSGNNLTKLNLTLCKDTKIEISIAVKIDGSLDKYNLKSDYYNDICSTTTSESGTDISLKDRKNEFIDNNMSLCEENCELIDYNPIKEKAKCSCDVKLSIPENYDIKFNKNDFLKSFADIKNILNLNIIKCYKTVLNIKRLMKNYGFFIVGSIIILYFLTLFIFSYYSYDKIKKEVLNIIFALQIKANPIKINEIKRFQNKITMKIKKRKNIT